MLPALRPLVLMLARRAPLPVLMELLSAEFSEQPVLHLLVVSYSIVLVELMALLPNLLVFL
jgi:hypothetical protein